MKITDRVMALAQGSQARYEDRTGIREKRLREVAKGNVLAADDPARIAKRLKHVQVTEQRVATPFAAVRERMTIVPAATPSVVDTIVTQIARERTIGRDDLVAPQFLKLALAASRCVCRITVRGASGAILGYGTGMLVGPGVLLTNNHVLESNADAAQSEVTFGFESAKNSEERLFGLEPQRLFITDETLDFTFVAVAAADSHGRPIDDLGYVALNQEEGKAINGEFVNIIQHPDGGPKMFALRENKIVDVLTNFLQYVADTAPGSSGAPVFNDQFELVALHHSGVPARDEQGRVLNRSGQPWTDDQGEAAVQWKANEGVRISVLAERAKALAKTSEEQALLVKAMDVSRSVPTFELSAAPGSPVPPALGVAATVSGGAVTWTIPLTVSVNLGGLPAPMIAAAAAANAMAAPPARALLSAPRVPAANLVELQRAVDRARELFASVPGVLRVRAGWQFADGWITDKKAIVVVVDEKKTTEALNAEGGVKVPTSFENFPVDVRQATAEELYELGRLGSGLALEERTPNPTYKRPNLPLPRVKEKMKATIHVSPEYGWPQLKDFLARTNHSLSVAMYDFSAPHIVRAIQTRLAANHGKMELVLQYGTSLDNGAKADDIEDTATVEQLKGALGANFHSQWANVSEKGSLWASAYHIKVAVRDSSAFWLSSGNWQSSNQPEDAPPTGTEEQKDLLTGYNREWHAVIENETLASVFEAFIKYDFDQSKGFVPKGSVDAVELMPPRMPDEREATAEITIFEPIEIDRVVDVQPVLTPDNYVDIVLPLIKSAKKKLYFQNQYIHESLDKRALNDYVPMLEAIAEKQDDGVDVRIILRSDTPVEARHIEFMKTHGIDMSKVKWRRRTHTKGIIVDSTRVLLGSHNWSYDGVALNRDASLLFYDAEIAQYLERIFIYDWENWSKSKVSIVQKKPKVTEIKSASELESLKSAIRDGKVEARRLFHPDD
jgi:V8-like Glu-specific endopeptidase